MRSHRKQERPPIWPPSFKQRGPALVTVMFWPQNARAVPVIDKDGSSGERVFLFFCTVLRERERERERCGFGFASRKTALAVPNLLSVPAKTRPALSGRVRSDGIWNCHSPLHVRRKSNIHRISGSRSLKLKSLKNAIPYPQPFHTLTRLPRCDNDSCGSSF